MEPTKERKDDYEQRRKHLEHLTDEELKVYFWQLINRVVDPLLDLAKKNTTPSIERSVLLRMGFSSIEANGLVKKMIDHRLISKGAGNVVFRLAKKDQTDQRTAGLKLLRDEGWTEMEQEFGVK